MMLMPSIAIAPQIEEESIVEEMCNPDPVEDRHEKNVPMDDVEKNSEIKGPTGCVENDSVQNLADPVQNTGFEDTSSVLNNAGKVCNDSFTKSFNCRILKVYSDP